MAFVVETGSGSSSSNSYVSVADADSYFTDRNVSTWGALSTPAKQAALLYATAYVDANFDFPGYLQASEQALDWPRSGAYDNETRILTGIPQKLKDAVCELALVHANTEALNTTFEGSNVKSEKVGSIAVEYFQGGSQGASYPFLEKLLGSIIITGSAGIVNLIRG